MFESHLLLMVGVALMTGLALVVAVRPHGRLGIRPSRVPTHF